MKIQNRALAGVVLSLRFTSGETAKGDAHGVFDLPEEDALFLLGTSGWAQVATSPESSDLIAAQTADAAQASLLRDQELAAEAAKKAAEAAALAANPPVIVPADDAAEKAAEADAANVTAGVPALDTPVDDGEGPDLTKLDRDGLVKVAQEYGITIDKRWGDERLRATLDVALYGDDDEVKE